MLAQAITRVNQRLADAMTGGSALEASALFDMVAEYYRAEGRVRTLAWLVLSERAPQVHARTRARRPLEPLIELVHAQRRKAYPNDRVDLADSRFLCELAAFALLGEALFGDLVRDAFGAAKDAAASRDFRRRFVRLLTDGSRLPVTKHEPARE